MQSLVLPRPRRLFRGLGWAFKRLLEADQAYRRRRALDRMPIERLRDMGIPERPEF